MLRLYQIGASRKTLNRVRLITLARPWKRSSGSCTQTGLTTARTPGKSKRCPDEARAEFREKSSAFANRDLERIFFKRQSPARWQPLRDSGPTEPGEVLRDKHGPTSAAFRDRRAIGNTIGALVGTAGRGKAEIETIS